MYQHLADPVPSLPANHREPAWSEYAVLVVDDEAGVRNFLERALRARGCRVEVAGSAEEGAERLREKIAAANPGGLPVTASFGIATLAPGENFDKLFSRADAALYEAKRGGRNQVVSA